MITQLLHQSRQITTICLLNTSGQDMKNECANPILITGGYGVVGSQIAKIIRQRHPVIPILLAGRNPASAQTLIESLGNAKSVTIDVESEAPLANLPITPSVVLNVVNDTHNYLLLDCVNKGIGYIDITRWTERMREAIVQVTMKNNLRAPVMFGSAWMAGVTAILAQAASESFDEVDSIDLDILFAMADKAGPNSAEYMDRLTIPFNIKVNNELQQRMPFSEPKEVTFPNGYSGKVYRFDVPDQMTLPSTTGAKNVNGRIGFDSSSATGSLAFMVNSGIMKLLNRPMFDGVRRGLLYNPGKGAAHELVIEVTGKDAKGQQKTKRVTAVDPEGQTHMTACGAVVQLERVLGLDGMPASDIGIHFPEKGSNIGAALHLLRSNGVLIEGISEVFESA